MRPIFVAVLALIAGAGVSCVDPRGALSGEGTMHQGVGPECPKTWHIATSTGRILWPVEDPEFQQEGLRVRYEVRERKGTASICMAGIMVEVVSLKKI